jgi:hypothetical protein
MKKNIDRYLFIISILLKLPNIQVLSQNQSSNRFIISKKEQQAKFALLTIVKEELPNEEYKVKFNISSLSGLQPSIKHYLSTEIYLSKLKFYLLQSCDTKFIKTKKNTSIAIEFK